MKHLEKMKTVVWKRKPNIIHYGTDGFGHQLEGIIGAIAMHFNDKVNYIFNHKRKKYRFEHLNHKGCELYLKNVFVNILKDHPKEDMKIKEIIHSHEVFKIPENPDNKVIYSIDNIYREPNIHMINSKEKIKYYFTKNNIYLPEPSFKNDKRHNIVIHIRKGDTLSRQKELKELGLVIKNIQKRKNILITIHSNGILKEYENNENTVLKGRNTEVLQVLSDMINAETLIISQSSLSYIATWLTNAKEVYTPDFIHTNWLSRRIHPGFKKYSDLL